MAAIILFALLLVVSFGFFAYNAGKIRKNILMGRDVDRSDNRSERLKVMTLVAFGQSKMFKKPIPAILHFFLYAAFIITQIELIEIIVDGLTGEHRVFRASLGGFYTFIISFIEILSVLAFIGTIIFLARRNLLHIPRFRMREMKKWPKLDGNLILILEIILLTFIFTMNGTDEVLYRRGISHAEALNDESFGFAISQFLGPAVFGNMASETLFTLERIAWWGHIVMVFVFLNYLPFSKHIHIILAFPNTYYSKLLKKGQFTNMESVTNEVKLMMDPEADPYAAPAADAQPVGRFGAKDVNDLTWKNLLDAYTCTECGRCSANCPATQTGKLLSPRKIMMDTRDRMEEKGKTLRKRGKDYDDGKSLLGDHILEEELWACTTCMACVEACPVNIDPVSIIMEMRRYLVMEESKVPTELAGMLSNVENNGAPWQFSQDDRLNWRDED
ncbi:MAG: (Fe-S)-binding protein [Brumimicrobium sp.]|nr:(Fe-S)-binding protein [Brumimicrobium sp.]